MKIYKNIKKMVWTFASGFVATATLSGVACICSLSATMRNGEPSGNDIHGFIGYREDSFEGGTCFLDESGRASYCVTSYNKMTNGYKYNHR